MELRGRGLRFLRPIDGQRELHLRGQQAGTCQPVPRVFGEGSVEQHGGTVGIAAHQLQQSEPRCGLAPKLVSLSEGVLGTLQVTGAQADLAQLIEGFGCRRGRPVAELVARALRILTRGRPVPSEPHHLGAVHAAHAWEAVDCLPVAPALAASVQSLARR